MATAQKKKRREESGMVSRLAEKGEDAINRLVDELRKNPTTADALHRAMSAKGKLDSASHAALSQLGLASADEVKDLRGKVDALEKRVAKLEGPAKRPPARRPAKKPARGTGAAETT